MRAFRRHTILGFFALLAFGLQAVLAFAHMHAHTHAAAGARDMASRAITYGMCRPNAGRTCPAPARHHEPDCPVCWTTSLASSAVLEAPPVLTLTAVGICAALPVRGVSQLTGSPAIQFNARAPPHAALV